jgi:hypothetical protein
MLLNHFIALNVTEQQQAASTSIGLLSFSLHCRACWRTRTLFPELPL